MPPSLRTLTRVPLDARRALLGPYRCRLQRLELSPAGVVTVEGADVRVAGTAEAGVRLVRPLVNGAGTCELAGVLVDQHPLVPELAQPFEDLGRGAEVRVVLEEEHRPNAADQLEVREQDRHVHPVGIELQQGWTLEPWVLAQHLRERLRRKLVVARL